MDQVISNKKKKAFLKWITQNHQLKTRESLWILDFLYTHDSMLKKTHFVERVDQTPRGIYMGVRGSDKTDFIFYKNGHVYEDPMKAFHEVRLNWSSDLYIEVGFEEAWEVPEYLSVLEDNPYASWNEKVSEELFAEMDSALAYVSLEANQQSVLNQINELLETGTDKEEFQRLTNTLERIEKELEKITLKDL